MIERILHNAQLYTPQEGRSTALAIIGERIVAVGGEHEILPLASATTEVENLNGQVVIPGLIDAHIHYENTAKALHMVDLMGAASQAEALTRIQAYLPKLAPGEWLLGRGWLQDLWEDSGRHFPTKADLDALTGDIPAYLTGKSGHVVWVNSAALKVAGITSNTPDPLGGKLERDEHGQPTGILFEMPAMDLVYRHVPEPSPERLADWMLALQQAAWACGLTAIHDYDAPSCMAALQILRERGELGLRVVKHINVEWVDHAHELGIRTNFGDVWLRIGALKLFADGALGARTASMIEPYDGEPHNYGVEVTDKETMYELASRASRLGLPTTIHAIGDRAVHDVLDVFQAVREEEAAAGIPRHARRHRIEHVQVVHPDDLNRLGELGIIAGMQPIHAASDWHMAERYWGKRARYSYAWRTQLQAGAVLAFGSDSPIDPFDPRMGLYAAVTRRDLEKQPHGGWFPEERLTLPKAIHAYTVGAAYAGGMEAHQGKLQAGYLADLIVLDRNPFNIPPDELLEIQITGTMVGGQWRGR